MRRFGAIILLLLCGCAQVHVDCPYNTVEYVKINDTSTKALVAAVLAGLAAGGVLMAAKSPPPIVLPPPDARRTTVDMWYVPFGTDSIECGQGPMS